MAAGGRESNSPASTMLPGASNDGSRAAAALAPSNGTDASAGPATPERPTSESLTTSKSRSTTVTESVRRRIEPSM